jgi:hypothetical protein
MSIMEVIVNLHYLNLAMATKISLTSLKLNRIKQIIKDELPLLKKDKV